MTDAPSLPYDAVALREKIARLREIAKDLDSLAQSNACGFTGLLAEEMDEILQALTPMKGEETP